MTQRLLCDSSSYDGVMISDLLNNDWQDISSSPLLEHENRRAALTAIIQQMETVSPSWDGSDGTVISPESSETAIRFLAALPTNRELPKVAPDGEGNVIFVWEPPHGNCLVTVVPNCLHMVDKPGGLAVQHIDDQEFTGNRIPLLILSALPLK